MNDLPGLTKSLRKLSNRFGMMVVWSVELHCIFYLSLFYTYPEVEEISKNLSIEFAKELGNFPVLGDFYFLYRKNNTRSYPRKLMVQISFFVTLAFVLLGQSSARNSAKGVRGEVRADRCPKRGEAKIAFY